MTTGITGATAAPSPGPDLRADVNRDGRVDVRGDSDQAGEDGWTASRGAVALPNIDDDSRRCPVRDARGRPLSDARLVSCNDASDGIVNGAADARDLAKVRSVPQPGVAANATGTVKAVGAGASKARVFVKRSGAWKQLRAGDRLTAGELRRGVELGVEAKDVMRDAAVWDGRITLRLAVSQNGATSSDQVTLRVAPVLTHHHLQRAKQVMVTETAGDREQRKFVKRLGEIVRAAGINKPLGKFTKYGDIWAQDFFEPGYTAMPGPGGKPQTMRVLIRSAQPDREAGRELYEKLRGPGVAVVQVANSPRSGEWSLNSMGNLETIPPHRHAGKDFPAGRIIMGQRKDSGAKPAKKMTDFLRAQGMQSPLLLDTSWLEVGHVDEFIQFLPADTPRGWRVGIADPDAGLDLLRKAQREGHGAKRMFSIPSQGRDRPAPKDTIDDVLGSQEFLAGNRHAAERIKANLEIIKRETGVTDAEIVRVPSLYSRTSQEGNAGDPAVTNSGELQRLGPGTWDGQSQLDGAPSGPRGRDAAAPSTIQTSAYVPGAVNGVVLSPNRYLAAKQWGPVIGGRDVFGKAVEEVYRKAGFTTVYLDDWHTYHKGQGEVHCGTNTLRATPAWWPAGR
ncbi:protein-arginine deiminase domain-containing protein [Streptomyces sp. NPDC091377]|uniref:protein-arginine deiminase domain-containing protein n=1 Tax=Streptomyces sp. NPDC091377 TaxID=3365995 RepID=UPI00381E80FE